MQKNASPTCQYGIASSRNRVWNSNFNKIIKNQHLRIKSGKFQKELSDTKLVNKTVEKFLSSKISNQIKNTEKNLKIKLNKLKD